MSYYPAMRYCTSALACLTITITSLSGCAQTHATKSAPPAHVAATSELERADHSPIPTTSPAQSNLTPQLLYEILVGEISFNDADVQQGATYLLHAAQQAHSAELFQRATEMAIVSHNGPVALEAVRAWRAAEPQSVDASRYELQVLLALGRPEATEAPLRNLLQVLPEDDKVALISAVPAVYEQASDKSKTTQLVERALNPVLDDPKLAPAAWTSIGRMRLQAGDARGAFNALTLGQKIDQSSEWPAMLALQLFAQDGSEKAEAAINRYLSHAKKPAPEVRLDYARVLIDRGRISEAKNQLKRITREEPKYADAWLMLGMVRMEQKENAEATQALTHYLEVSDSTDNQNGSLATSAGRDQAHLLLARLAREEGDFAKAREQLAKINAADQALTINIEEAKMLAREGKLDLARRAIRSTGEEGPDDVRLKLLAEAQLLRDNNQAGEAWLLLNRALAETPDDEALLYDAAMAAEQIDRVDDMEKLLRRLISLKPDAGYAYNALGYSLADRGLRLTEARRLIEKAAKLSPNDAYIQDSLGWADFRLGKTHQALETLRKAFAARPDPEIAAHLGEVLWSLHEHDEAVTIWRQGIQMDASNKTLRETMQRFGIQP